MLEGYETYITTIVVLDCMIESIQFTMTVCYGVFSLCTIALGN